MEKGKRIIDMFFLSIVIILVLGVAIGIITEKVKKSIRKRGGVKRYMENREIKISKIIGIGVGTIVGIILLFGSFYTVDTGEVAIISRFGKVTSIENAGLHFKIPIIERKDKMEIREKIYSFTKAGYLDKFDEKEGENDNSLTASTKDIQSVNIEITVQASITDPEKLYKSFKGLHEDRFIRPRVREIVQAIIAKYTVEEFVSKRAEISNIIFEDLKDDFEKYGLNASNISIVNHDFSDEYEKAIEQKKVAEQAVERAKAEVEKLSVEAENKIKLAEYRLREKKLQAEANKVETSSLSPQILQKMAIEKWDGVLPKVQTKGNGILLNSDLLKGEN